MLAEKGFICLCGAVEFGEVSTPACQNLHNCRRTEVQSVRGTGPSPAGRA